MLTPERGVVEGDIKQINFNKTISVIDVADPTVDELKEIHHIFSIPTSDIRHCLDLNESARIRQAKDYALIIYSQAHCNEEAKRCGPIGIFLTKRYMIIIHTDKLNFFEELQANPQTAVQMFHAGADIILLRLFYHLIKGKEKMLENIEESLEMIENDVMTGKDNARVQQRIFALKNSSLYLKKSVSGNRNVITELIKNVPLIREKSLFIDLNIELMQINETLEICRERLTTILEVHVSNVSNRINAVMKYLTAVTAVLLVPTVITSAYGMNIKLPFQEHAQAFWIIAGILVISSMITLFFFYNKKWI